MDKENLRSMFDHRKQMWKIVRKTDNGAGGWRRFGEYWYFSQVDADAKITKLIEDQPNHYQNG